MFHYLFKAKWNSKYNSYFIIKVSIQCKAQNLGINEPRAEWNAILVNILKLKTTVLLQKFIIFCSLVNKYSSLLLFFILTHAQKNVNITSMAYNGKNVRCKNQEILQTLLARGLKGREI